MNTLMKTALFGCLLALSTACASSGSAPAAKIDPMAEMDAMLKLAELSEAHEEFAMQEGIWQTTMKTYMEPGMPPMIVEGESVIRTVMGGRYMIEEFRSDFMGMEFEGMLIRGYDNLSQEHWSIWMDSMSTGFSASAGQENADGSLELKGMMKDLRTPKGRPMRSVITPKGDNAVHFSMYDTGPDGSEVLVMEIDYTR